MSDSIRRAVTHEWRTSYEMAKPIGARSGEVEKQMRRLERYGIVEKRPLSKPTGRPGRDPAYEWRLVR